MYFRHSINLQGNVTIKLPMRPSCSDFSGVLVMKILIVLLTVFFMAACANLYDSKEKAQLFEENFVGEHSVLASCVANKKTRSPMAGHSCVSCKSETGYTRISMHRKFMRTIQGICITLMQLMRPRIPTLFSSMVTRHRKSCHPRSAARMINMFMRLP